MNNKELQILNNYNCDIDKLQEVLDNSCPMYQELSYRKISECIPHTTRFSIDGTNPRQILIETILKELSNENNC